MESLTENRSLLYRFDLCFSLSGFSPQISLVLSFQIFLVLSFQSLLHSLAGAGGFVVMLALGWLPEFSDQFSIVDFSDEFRSILLQVRVFATFLGFNVCPFQVRFLLVFSVQSLSFSGVSCGRCCGLYLGSSPHVLVWGGEADHQDVSCRGKISD